MLTPILNLNHKLSPLWFSCLSASFRTALACSIVAAATLFGPAALRRQVAFPAFSYVTVILIVTGASLGDALRGCYDAVCATFLTVIPAILGLWAIGPARLTTALTSAVVGMAAFVVMLPDHRTHLVSKRIALGQIVIVYVVAYDMGGETDPVMHPVHVAASTAIGVLACVIALLLPYPSLATCQVKKKCKLYADNASERLKLCLKAFCAEDNTSAQAFASQANSLSINGTKLLNAINSKKESMKWETLPIEFLKPYCMNTAQKLQAMEMPIKGLQIALHHVHSFPPQILNHDLKDNLHKLQENITLTFDQLKSCMPSDHLATFPESNLENLMLPFHSFPQTHKDLSSFFFLFCSKLLQRKMTESPSAKNPPSSSDEQRSKKNPEWNLSKWIGTLVSHRRFMLALKCSLSVGFAVLFGLIYSKQNGIWSGLPVAISFAASREAVFRVSNIKAQGTVIGTVYGVLGCFVLEKFVKVRFLILLPWFIFCSLIRRSRMYGPAGGVSAVIGAVLVLGRENFGSPTEFAINRIVEAFIGLSCSIVVELVFQPTRASTLAKIQLSKTLQVLHECVCTVSIGNVSKDCNDGGRKKLKAKVNELRKFIEEAEMEPNFWFLPFHGVCYNKFLKSLSNMEGLLVFMNHANESLEKESRKMGRNNMSFKVLESDVELFKEMIHTSIKCFERVVLVKSLNKLDKDLQKSSPSIDIELGKLPISPQKLNVLGEDEMDNMVNSYLERSKELVLGEGREEVKGHELVLSLSAFAFCLRGLVRETKEIEKGVMELLQWENPSSHVNLYEISCKIHALCDI